MPCLFYQFEDGGPIIAVQVENEYGSYAKDEKYMPFIKDVSLLVYFFYFLIHCNVVHLALYANNPFIFSCSVSCLEESRSSC